MNRKEMQMQLSNAVIDLMNDNNKEWREFFTKTVKQGNGKTGRKYTGGNQVMLERKKETMNYESNEWLTGKQIEELGLTLKEGEKYNPTYIQTIFFKPYASGKRKSSNPNESYGGVKVWELWNGSQIENYTDKTTDNNVAYQDVRKRLEAKGYSFVEEGYMTYLQDNTFHIPEAISEEEKDYYNMQILNAYYNTQLKKEGDPLNEFVKEIATLLTLRDKVVFSEDEKEAREKATLAYKTLISGHPECLNRALNEAFKLAENF